MLEQDKDQITEQEKRKSLLERLGRRMNYATPALLLVASGAAAQAVASDLNAEPAYTSGQEAPLMLAEAHHVAPAAADDGEDDDEEEKAEDEGEAEG